MRVVVTGGTGFIGSNLALELEKQGHEVTVIDNFSSGNPKIRLNGLVFVNIAVPAYPLRPFEEFQYSS